MATIVPSFCTTNLGSFTAVGVAPGLGCAAAFGKVTLRGAARRGAGHEGRMALSSFDRSHRPSHGGPPRWGMTSRRVSSSIREWGNLHLI